MVKEASKLSDKEIRQTIGNIEKKRKVKLFRNVLAFPYTKSWPVVDLAEAEGLINLLEELLPEAKICCTKPLWRDICKLTKEQRKIILEKKQATNKNKINVNRSLILPGYSRVTRGLEKGEICCCILAKEVEPPILLKNLVSLSEHKKVPVVIIPSLKSLTKKTLNFSATAIGFKVIVKKETSCIFHPIFKCVEELSKIYQTMNEKSINIVNNDLAKATPKPTTAPATNTKTNFHLYVSSPNESRVYVPPREHENCDFPNNTTDLGFISLNNSPKLTSEAYFDNSMKDEEESDDDIIDCDEIFQIDTKPDDLLKKSWDETKGKHARKRKKGKHYQGTKIKLIKSNPMKALKKKKKNN